MQRSVALALAVAMASAACSPPAATQEARPATTAGSEGAVRGIELTLRRADGTFIEVGELRGDVVLLFVFATFDATSQMVLTPLRAIAERFPDTRIIGIAAQPSARLLVDAYEHALSPPFIVTYDPEETVAEGQSALGEIEGVPTLIVLDRRGVEVARHFGFADEARIAELLAAAR
jgi:hypothetical protein